MHPDRREPVDRLLTEVEAAQFLNISIRTLQAWRTRGGGPLFIRLGRAVRYRQSALEAWLNANTMAHTSAAAEVA